MLSIHKSRIEPAVRYGRRHQLVRTLLLISLMGHLHWFFGNLYEVIVISPNLHLMPAPANQLRLWRQLHALTNPIYYFLPWNPLTILLTIVTAGLGWSWASVTQKRWLLQTAIGSVLIGGVTAYIITTVNLHIFVGELRLDDVRINALIARGFWLSILRLLTEGVTVWSGWQALRHWQGNDQPI